MLVVYLPLELPLPLALKIVSFGTVFITRQLSMEVQLVLDTQMLGILIEFSLNLLMWVYKKLCTGLEPVTLRLKV